MKTLAELQAIREKMQSQVNMRAEDHDHIRVVVGMATCGIAAGARPVLNTLADEVQKRGLTNKISVTQTGCIGLCQYEPIVEVMEPGQPAYDSSTFWHQTDRESYLRETIPYY
jgi:NADP-reducing hydrogenase subunit HndB